MSGRSCANPEDSVPLDAFRPERLATLCKDTTALPGHLYQAEQMHKHS